MTSSLVRLTPYLISLLSFVLNNLTEASTPAGATQVCVVYAHLSSSSMIPDKLNASFVYENVRHNLKLQKNNELVSSKLLSGISQISGCYYQGFCQVSSHISREDYISLSACDGLRGLVQIFGKPYQIAPLGRPVEEGCQPHYLVPSQTSKSSQCFTHKSNLWTPLETLHSRDIANLQQQTQAGVKTVRMGLLVDKSLYSLFGEQESRITEFLLDLTNMVDMYTQRLNIRVTLTFKEIWSGRDRVVIASRLRDTVANMLTLSTANQLNTEWDVLHLLSGRTFDSCGLAIPDSICTGRSLAVISAQPDNPAHTATLITRMLGHILGLPYDDPDCFCTTAGCMMGNHSGISQGFSFCSISRLQYLNSIGLYNCLVTEADNNPLKQFCGNGIVERGEQCDCGPQQSCETREPCCDPNTCLLKPWATCSKGSCCEGCLPKSADNICRKSTTDCDPAEFCDGISGQCPDDVLIQDGEPCAFGNAFCYQGRCPTPDQQCSNAWGSNSTAAEYCFSHNLVGNPSGHCGEQSDDRYRPCAEGNELCGLLQCKGGNKYPIINADYRKTTIGGKQGEQECKTVGGGTITGLVEDGTKCDSHALCLTGTCIDIQTLGHKPCPKNTNNLTCSGQGRCTTRQTCHCNEGLSGSLCERRAIISSGAPGVDITVRPSPMTAPITVGLRDHTGLAVCLSLLLTVLLVVVIAILMLRRRGYIRSWKLWKIAQVTDSSSDQSSQAILYNERVYDIRSLVSDDITPRVVTANIRPYDIVDNNCSSEEDLTAPIIVHSPSATQPRKGILKKPQLIATTSVSDSDSDCSCNGSCSCSDVSCHSCESGGSNPSIQSIPSVLSNVSNASRSHSHDRDSAIDLPLGDSSVSTVDEREPRYSAPYIPQPTDHIDYSSSHTILAQRESPIYDVPNWKRKLDNARRFQSTETIRAPRIPNPDVTSHSHDSLAGELAPDVIVLTNFTHRPELGPTVLFRPIGSSESLS